MPEPRAIVINTGPLIALTAACGNLRLLGALYGRVVVPLEVSTEVLARDGLLPGAAEFRAATWLDRRRTPCVLSPLLRNALDAGEAAVIHTALAEGIGTVCIDEQVGRRVARLHGLLLTGSLGVLIRARREGHPVVVRECIERMQARGIRFGSQVVQAALTQAGEA
jgi:predicted nucleic acid-binding protein